METKKQILLIAPLMALTSEFTEKLSHAFTVLTATSEEEGYRILVKHPTEIAAVLLDLNFARESNYEFVKKVSLDKLFTAIPVIALSPNLPSEEDMECLKHGFSELLGTAGETDQQRHPRQRFPHLQ